MQSLAINKILEYNYFMEFEPEENLNEVSKEIYKAKAKFFGDRAQRIVSRELEPTLQEVLNLASGKLGDLKPVKQLADKESFGDLDIICLSEIILDEEYLKKVFGDNLLDYNKTGHVYSTLLVLDSGKTVQVDFIRAKSQEDFDRKFIYYSKGHLSSVIGMLARELNFKYGTEGFFKRFQDKKGNWHDILISDDLNDGLKILGLDQERYELISATEDIVEFIGQSPYFDSSYFESNNLNRRDRDAVKRNQQADYIVEKLVAKNKKRNIDDSDEFFKKYFPEKFSGYLKEAERIEKETYRRGAISGLVIMEVFNLKSGPEIGKILKFISDNYPDIENLSDEIISEIKTKILNDQR